MKKLGIALTTLCVLALSSGCAPIPTVTSYVPGPPVTVEDSEITTFCESIFKCEGRAEEYKFEDCEPNYHNLINDPACGNAMATLVKCALDKIDNNEDICHLDKSSCRDAMNNYVSCTVMNVNVSM